MKRNQWRAGGVVAFIGYVAAAGLAAPAQAQDERAVRHRVPAEFMSYLGADWLERPERIEQEQPEQVLDAMALRPGDVVAFHRPYKRIGVAKGDVALRAAPGAGENGSRPPSRFMARDRLRRPVPAQPRGRQRAGHDAMARSPGPWPRSRPLRGAAAISVR